ncbi:MAG: NERD domain-containing protein [Rhodoferax sp.]|nr:NERD domain-containing protein [Rhodoferax sp.]
MILKELDPFLGRTKDEVTARIAQDRMAYQLRRFFGKSADVDVLNYLRIGSGSAVAHVDYLLLHPYGLLVLERESLAERVQIKDDGHWMRWRDGAMVEMRSPITRAYLRALSLKAFLDKNVRQKGFFDRVELDVLVAVPDTNVIQWPTMGPLVEVCNFEQVKDRVEQRLAQCRRVATVPGLLSASERRRLAEFLRSLHRPIGKTASQ